MSFTGTVCHCGADGTWLCTSPALPQQEGGAGRSPVRGEDTLTLYTAFCDACCHSLCQRLWGGVGLVSPQDEGAGNTAREVLSKQKEAEPPTWSVGGWRPTKVEQRS